MISREVYEKKSVICPLGHIINLTYDPTTVIVSVVVDSFIVGKCCFSLPRQYRPCHNNAEPYSNLAKCSLL